jgi:putative ABC transport system permease protein
MFLALREIRRARWRFVLLTGAVGLLVFLILFVQALTGALIGQFIGALDHQSADVLVYSAQARKNLEGSVVPPATVDAVANVPGVARAGPLGEGTFTVRAARKLRDAALIGYEPGGPGAPTTLVEGRLPTRPFEAVASSRNADEGFGIGDTVRLERGGRTIKVVGLARDVNYSVLPTLFTTFPTYVAARRDANPQATAVYPSAVAVRIAEGSDAATVRAAINRRISGVEALTRAQAVSESPGVASVGESLGMVVFLCFFVVVVVAGLFFLILTVQKAGALTLLRAVGVGAGALARSLLVQVVVVVVGGVVVGAALTSAALAASNSSLGAGLAVSGVVRTGALVLVLACVASLGAVRRVLRIDPAHALTPGGIA